MCQTDFFLFHFLDKMSEVFLLGCLIYSLDSPVVMFVLLELCCEVELNNFTHQSVFLYIFYVYVLWDYKITQNAHY